MMNAKANRVGMNMSRRLLLDSSSGSLRATGATRPYSASSVVLKPIQQEPEADQANFPEPQYWVPREERKSKSVFRADNTLWFGSTRLARNDRRCPSRDLNFTPLDWANHKSPFRRIRHMFNIFHSSTFQRLAFPELTSTATIALGLAYYNEIVAGGIVDQMISISPTAFGGATTAIGILSGFRLNASYGRYEECRIFWGDTNNTIRDLARETMMWMKDEEQKDRMLKLCKAYPVVLNFHLNAKGGHHNIPRFPKSSPEKDHSFEDRIHAEFLAELRGIYTCKDTDKIAEQDYQRIAKVKYNGGNTSLEVLTLMGETIAASVGTVDPIYVREMDEQCQRLCASFGASERVLRTSLPTSFTRHTSRLMFCWSNALPFALYPALGPFGTAPAAVFTSWALQSIEDIGVQIEEPFYVLPMRQYSDGMFDAIGQIERNYRKYELKSNAEREEDDKVGATVDLHNLESDDEAEQAVTTKASSAPKNDTIPFAGAAAAYSTSSAKPSEDKSM